MFEIIIGRADRDLFARPGTGHRTYPASDGHTYTGVESWDALYACSTPCRDALVSDYPVRALEPVDDGHRTGEVHVAPGDYGHHIDATIYPLNPDAVADYQLPVICTHCDTVMVGPSPPTTARPHPANYTVTVAHTDGRNSVVAMASLPDAATHAGAIATMTAAHDDLTVTLATGPDYHGPTWERTITSPFDEQGWR